MAIRGGSRFIKWRSGKFTARLGHRRERITFRENLDSGTDPVIRRLCPPLFSINSCLYASARVDAYAGLIVLNTGSVIRTNFNVVPSQP